MESALLYIFAVDNEDDWISLNLPPTPALVRYPNGHCRYFYRNSEHLPPGVFWWLQTGRGHIVSTEIEDITFTPEGIPDFPVCSGQMTQIEDQGDSSVKS